MPAILVWLGSLIVTNIGYWVVSLLLSLGVGLAAHAVAPGIISAVPIFAKFQASSVMWNWVGYLNIDTDITIILSAWAGRTLTDSMKVHLTAIPKAA